MENPNYSMQYLFNIIIFTKGVNNSGGQYILNIYIYNKNVTLFIDEVQDSHTVSPMLHSESQEEQCSLAVIKLIKFTGERLLLSWERGCFQPSNISAKEHNLIQLLALLHRRIFRTSVTFDGIDVESQKPKRLWHD